MRVCMYVATYVADLTTMCVRTQSVFTMDCFRYTFVPHFPSLLFQRVPRQGS